MWCGQYNNYIPNCWVIVGRLMFIYNYFIHYKCKIIWTSDRKESEMKQEGLDFDSVDRKVRTGGNGCIISHSHSLRREVMNRSLSSLYIVYNKVKKRIFVHRHNEGRAIQKYRQFVKGRKEILVHFRADDYSFFNVYCNNWSVI